MHNFSKPQISVPDSLKMVGKGLHSPKKEFFASNRDLLEALYVEYDQHADRDELHLLKKQWPIKNEDDDIAKADITGKRSCANQLYGDNRPFVNNHWEYLTKNNGGETLYCPICGLHECEEMDHYLPRDEMEYPEYSAHLSNLIPLCHSCNNKKSTKFLDEKGNRLFFNAFYDILQDRRIIVCAISLNPNDKMPQIKVLINPSLSVSKKPDVYILSTISKLNLLKRFNSKAKLLLKRELNRLKRRAGQEWSEISSEMASLALPDASDPDIVYPAVLSAMSTSSVIKTWFESL